VREPVGVAELRFEEGGDVKGGGDGGGAVRVYVGGLDEVEKMVVLPVCERASLRRLSTPARCTH
jgi:hypothetical protein